MPKEKKTTTSKGDKVITLVHRQQDRRAQWKHVSLPLTYCPGPTQLCACHNRMKSWCWTTSSSRTGHIVLVRICLHLWMQRAPCFRTSALTTKRYNSLLADIVSNLHNEVSKTDCQKIVNSLIEKDLVTSKVYGKQAIYVVRQDTIDTASPEQLAAVDREIAELQNKIGDHKTRNKQLLSGKCCRQG